MWVELPYSRAYQVVTRWSGWHYHHTNAATPVGSKMRLKTMEVPKTMGFNHHNRCMRKSSSDTAATSLLGSRHYTRVGVPICVWDSIS